MLINENKIIELRKAIEQKEETVCSGLNSSARWFVVSEAGYKNKNLIILPGKEDAEYCAADLYNIIDGDYVFFLPDSAKKIERSNYKASLNVQRTAAIGKITERGDEKLFIVTYPEALEERISSSKEKLRPFKTFTIGETISHKSIIETLSMNNFERVDFVSEPGQYAVRGGIIDLFSYSLGNPYRLSFFGDEIDKISIFNCNTQLSLETVESAEIFSFLDSEDSLSDTCPIIDIFPDDTLVWMDSSDVYSSRNFYPLLKRFKRVLINVPQGNNKEDSVKFNIYPQPVFNKNYELLLEDIKSKRDCGYTINIYGEKKSQLDRLRSVIVESCTVNVNYISGKNLHNGFIDKDSRICCYTDHEIFNRFHRVAIRRSVEKSEQLTINDLNALSIGDYIVHIDYGVGIFGGLVRMKDDKGRMHEVVKISYKDGDVIFISVHSLHKISRFKSKDSEPPKINKLGSKTWVNLKAGAKSKVKDIAKDLIKLYAERKSRDGFAFSPDSYLQKELESSFMYDDTPDQEKANEAIKIDMEDKCPMDRLICGDVGFGKTELAVRAAFKAVADNKQVAVLVPTTILALQHYNTFKNRLDGFPCNVEYVSRLKTAKEITVIKEKLKSGRTDIIIGTHKLLGEGFEFKDMGLLIIDEEQKFGVSAKEKLRTLKSSVDTLTLTATPIPRTLQFSLLGARDLSIINTPPPNRIPVQTEIINFDRAEVKSIIEYELNRGGQVFFVHNRVEELMGIHDILHHLLPDMKICVAHGQMAPKVLEDKILDFMEGDYDMLLCTTIIENGLDIPNANTIIINQAQNIGLSDLHQLRGRVGRSNKRSFCYLIVPPLASVSDDARRRLKAIEAFSDLGSGFNIAMQDLDIRGAGNLLGAEQSGFITDMGFETYQKILSEAMEELGVETFAGSERIRTDYFVTDCTVETDQEALIPDDYVDVTDEKIRIYKELDSIMDSKSLEKMKSRMEDRFGHLPPEVVNLFDVVRIRQRAQKLGFEKVIIKNGIMIMFFISNPLSNYFKSDTFTRVLDTVNRSGKTFEMKQVENKLKLISRGVDSLLKAYQIISMFKLND